MILEYMTLKNMIQIENHTIWIGLNKIIIIKALAQLCWGWLHKLCFSIQIYLESNPQIALIHIYFYYLHPHPLRSTPSLWWAINLHNQTFPYQRRCQPTLDMPKSSQMGFPNFIPFADDDDDATPK